MEQWRKDARQEAIIVDLDALVPQDHLLRKIEKVMDYEWLYERLDPYYCHDNGRPGTDPVVLIKMVLIQHLFGIPSLRQTYQRIQDTLSYRWFLGYGLLDEIPHFATVSYAFCRRFPEELSQEIFEHILNKALNNRMVDPSVIFIDGTHIKASANKGSFVVMKTGTHPMKTKLKLFFQWGITFGKPLEMPDQGSRSVHYASKQDLEMAILKAYPIIQTAPPVKQPTKPIPTVTINTEE